MWLQCWRAAILLFPLLLCVVLFTDGASGLATTACLELPVCATHAATSSSSSLFRRSAKSWLTIIRNQLITDTAAAAAAEPAEEESVHLSNVLSDVCPKKQSLLSRIFSSFSSRRATTEGHRADDGSHEKYLRALSQQRVRVDPRHNKKGPTYQHDTATVTTADLIEHEDSTAPLLLPQTRAHRISSASSSFFPAMLREVLVEVQGQRHAIQKITQLILHKLHHLDEPMAIHFVGDHGVGKTLSATLISLVWSLHCASGSGLQQQQQGRRGSRGSRCSSGDAMLIISGAAYEGMPINDATTQILRRIEIHARRFPYGMLVFDDFAALPRALSLALSPMFLPCSKAMVSDSLPLCAMIQNKTLNVSKLLIITTSDFGLQGRGRQAGSVQSREVLATRQLSDQLFSRDAVEGVDDEAESSADTEVKGNTVNMGHVVVFESLTEQTVKDIVNEYVTYLPCRDPRILSADITPRAVDAIVLSAGASLWAENGHALRRVLEELLDLAMEENLLSLARDDTIPFALFDVVKGSSSLSSPPLRSLLEMIVVVESNDVFEAKEEEEGTQRRDKEETFRGEL